MVFETAIDILSFLVYFTWTTLLRCILIKLGIYPSIKHDKYQTNT